MLHSYRHNPAIVSLKRDTILQLSISIGTPPYFCQEHLQNAYIEATTYGLRLLVDMKEKLAEKEGEPPAEPRRAPTQTLLYLQKYSEKSAR